ncbi:hypothetical protein GQ44DRAFT_775120 [Phaeosphaeriaceae sp. PMI808]|nr:hypothetical protein GQ44DRAFT_775120 [Phaeosphaeriaceae sp. PMI808]
MRYGVPSLAILGLVPSVLSAPAHVTVAPVAILDVTPAPSLDNVVVLEERQLLGGLLGGVNRVLGGLLDDVNRAVTAGNPNGVNSALVKIKPVSRPTDIVDAVARASKVWASPTGRTDIYAGIATQVAVGLGPLLDGTLNTLLTGGLPVGENSIDNNNPNPPSTIYPRKDREDAPYSVSEDALRKAIYIPLGFTYGSKRPVIMVPGSGSYGGIVYANNLRKLLTGQSFADPVWLNIPGALLRDAQVNSEYIAYAINYISAICLNAQWALKYWPSTRKVVKDFLPVSPDFRGTVLANALCPSPNSSFGLNPCPPAVVQQEATSGFVRALQSNGGNSAYVPTTTFYSGFFDEIVEPQQGTAASAYMNDARGVGVSNNEVQRVCAGRLGSSFYGHAGVLFNPVVYALIADALKNEGPGRADRIDIASVCDRYAAPGLDLDDVIATSGLIVVAGVSLLAYPDRRLTKPGLKSYARS